MNYHSPKYPYKLYVTGSDIFNNYFLFSHYLNEYRTDKTFLYSPKSSLVDAMSILYATCHNLCHLSCNINKGLEHYNASALNFKIADTADMLVAFSDGKDEGIIALQYAFTCKRKKSIIIDITKEDIITPSLALNHPTTKSIKFEDLYQSYIDKRSTSNSYTELAMKFLADAYNNKDLMKLIIDNKDTDLIVSDKLEESIKSLLIWIYNNQFDEFVNDYNNMVERELPPRMKRFAPDEYKHADKCEWKEGGEEVDLFTGTGLLLAKGYKSIVAYGEHTYIEIPDIMIMKAHIHKSMKSRAYTEDEDNCVKVTYHTSDTESYPLTYQIANFENSKFRMGYWYINSEFVTTIKPEIKKSIVLED